MTPVLLYALKVILCSSLLTGYYYLALRNKVFHQWNRFYLLLTVVLSLIVPLVHFTLFQTADDSNAAIQLLQTINGNGDEWVIIAGAKATPAFDWQLLATVFYSSVSLLLLVVLACSIIRLLMLVRQHVVQEVEDIHFINTDVPGTPFSFLRYIFWNRSIDVNSATGKQILKHELVHVREWHTADKLFLQVVLVFAWFNPVFWIIRHEIKMIHEFIADNKAVQGRDASELAAMILQAAYPTQFNHLVNPFFHQSIKRRLRMLTQIQNPRVNYFSRVLILPLVAGIVLLFSARIAAQNAPAPLQKKMVVVIDAGHGKKDGNYDGVHVKGIYEDQLTLAIAQQMKELNTDPNLQIVLTRTDEERVDLHQRVDKTVAAGADLFISLHVNAAPEGVITKTPTGKNTGFEIYTSWKNPKFTKENTRLASAITQSLKGLTTSTPTVAQRQTGIWVLDQAPCPAVLLECGYLTDAADRAFITNKANQKAVAQKILAGISAYVNAPETIAEVPIKNIEAIDVANDKVIITFKNGTTKTLSKKEAIQNGITLNATQEKNTKKQDKSINQAAGSVRLKGTDSLTKPLIVINGKIESTQAIADLPPNIIQEVNVLKDEVAIVKYGAAGKNGVIEITTKRAAQQESVKEVMVQGYKTSKEATEQKASVKEVTVTGHPIGKSASTEDAVVTGYPTNTPEAFQQTFTKVQEQARFPDENGGWQKFLSTNLNAQVPGSKGAPAGMYKVVVQMLIAKDGTIEEIRPLTSWGYSMEEEVVRALNLSPKWVPAQQNGHAVRSYHEQAITFVISE